MSEQASSSGKIGSVQTVLSALAVVASLVFVGYEIQQNTKAQRAQTRQELANGSREFILTLGADQELVRIYFGVFVPGAREAFQGAPLTPADSSQAQVLMFANLRNIENVYLQHAEGVVDESVLGSYSFVGPLFTSPTFLEWWGTVRDRFDASFIAAFESANGIQ